MALPVPDPKVRDRAKDEFRVGGVRLGMRCDDLAQDRHDDDEVSNRYALARVLERLACRRLDPNRKGEGDFDRLLEIGRAHV